MEQLQEHENESIYQRALKLLATYFGAAEEDGTNISPPVVNGGNQFSFGSSGAPGSQFTF